MKVLGLLGGMSWESSLVYYREINRYIQKHKEMHSSAKILMASVDFNEIVSLQHHGDWEAIAHLLIPIVKNLEKGGAESLVICTNTIHKIAPELASSVNIPILHIIDALVEKLIPYKFSSLGLLGTKFTMQEDFYRKMLGKKTQAQVVVPCQEDMMIIHTIIFYELCRGIIKQESVREYQRIIKNMQQQGAEAIILGCTEISLLIKPTDIEIPLFDTTNIHSHYAAQWSLS